MAIITSRGSGTPTTVNTVWTTTTNVYDGTPPANPATYAVWTSSTSGGIGQIFTSGYDFSAIPAGSTINSVTATLRHFENNITRISTVVLIPERANQSGLGASYNCTKATSARDDTSTPWVISLAELQAAGFHIKVAVTRAAVTQSATFNIDHCDVTVDYTPPQPSITQAAYQWFDEGTESGAVASAAQDTAVTGNVDSGDITRTLRVRLQSTTAVAAFATDDWQLQWEKNASGTWNKVPGTGVESITRTYDESNRNTSLGLYVGATYDAASQKIIGNGQYLTKIGFFLAKSGTPSGTIVVTLRNTFHTVVYATSTTVLDVSTLTTTFGWVDFSFDPILLADTGQYTIAIESPSGTSSSNTLLVGDDNTTPTDPEWAFLRTTGSWTTQNGIDLIYRVYTASGNTVLPYDSPNLTDAAATTTRLTGGTGTFVAGKVSEDGLVNDLGWAGNNHTELVYPLKIVAADVANSDTLRFRVLRNGVTTGLTYSATPTINVTKTEVAVTQAAYQWFDEGTETGAVALAAQNTPVTGNITNGDATGTLRMLLQSTTAASIPATDDWQLQWEKNASGTWADAISGNASVYDESNAGTTLSFGANNTNVMVGQTFLGNGSKLDRVSWWGNRLGDPTGSSVVRLYAHTGTFGTSGLPTGAILATSTPIDVTTISTTTGWIHYTFDGTVTLANGTPYCITWDCPGASVGNALRYAADTTASTHPGQFIYSTNGTSWISGTGDLVHMVHTASSVVVPYDSPNLTDAAATTNRLTGGTGTFTPGKVSEDGLVDDVGWSGNNYTELLYALKVIAADLADGDTLRLRVLRNGATTSLTYTATPTINIINLTVPPIPLEGSATGTSTCGGEAGGAAPALVQAATAAGGGPFNIVLPGVVVGNYVIVGSARYQDPVTSPSDSLGHTWTAVGALSSTLDGLCHCRMFYTKVASSGTMTITVIGHSGTAGEFSGLAASSVLDSSGNNAASGTSMTAGATGTLTQASSLIVAIVTHGEGMDLAITEDTADSFLLLGEEEDNGVSQAHNMQYKVVSSTSSVTPDWSRAGSSAPYSTQRAVFLGGGTGGGGGPALQVVRGLTGAASGLSTATGTLIVARSLAATSTGGSTTTAALARAVPIVGTAGGITSTSGTQQVIARALAGNSSATSTATGTLTVTGVFVPAHPGTRALEDGGQRNTEAGVYRELENYVAAGPVPIDASAGGSSTATGALVITRGLAASAPGVSTTTGAVVAARALVATAPAGSSTTTAALSLGRGLTSVAPAGTSTSVGTLRKAVPLSTGTSTATSSTTGDLTVAKAVVTFEGSSTGTSTFTCGGSGFQVARAFVGTSGGLSTTTGTRQVIERSLAAGAVTGTSTTAGTLTTVSSAVFTATANGSSTATGTGLTIARAFVGTSAASSTANLAAPSVARALAGTSTATSSVTGALARFVPLSATTVPGSSTTTATLTVARTMVGSAPGSSTTTGSLAVARALTAPVTGGSSTTSGVLAAARPLVATAAGIAVSTGAVIVARTLVADATGSSTATGNLVVARALVASSSGVTVTSGNMVASAAGGMSAFVQGMSTASGSLRVARPLAGSTGGLSSAGGTSVAKAVRLTGTTSGLSSTGAAVAIAKLLVGSSTGGSTVTGSFVGAVTLAGSSSGLAAPVGSLARAVPMAASASGGSTAPLAPIRIARPLAGSTSGLSTATAGTRVARTLQARADGISTADARVILEFGLVGLTEGVSTANGNLSAVLIIPIFGMWNGEYFEAMQYGDKQVVDWMMITS